MPNWAITCSLVEYNMTCIVDQTTPLRSDPCYAGLMSDIVYHIHQFSGTVRYRTVTQANNVKSMLQTNNER